MDTVDVTIMLNEPLARGIYKMILYFPTRPEALPEPGQFVSLAVPDRAHILRRPFSVHDADGAAGTVSVIYQVKGAGTQILSEMRPGEKVNLFYYLGRGYTLPEKAGRILLAGGGMGVAPLYYAAKYWRDSADFSAVLGFRSASLAYALNDFAAVCSDCRIVTEDGSAGLKGFVTGPLEEMLKSDPPDAVFACGPIPMLRAVQRLTAQYFVPTQLSLEERMGCGMGACVTCSCRIRSADGFDYKRVCADGPVFDAREVLFD